MSTRTLVAIPIAVLVAIIAVAILIFQLVAAQESEPRPVLPASMQGLKNRWQLPIELPAFLPDCLTYEDNAGSIVPEPDARDGQALRIDISAQNTAACSDFGSANISIVQAGALYSLEGDVTTVSYDRLQFARTQQPAGNGTERITLQWRCEGLMCRMNGTVDGPITEQLLVRIASSVQRTR